MTMNMAISKETNDANFAELQLLVSDWYDKHIPINMLKVLYRDHVKDTCALHNSSNMMQIINMLISFGNLSPNDLTLLYDTIKATEKFGLEQEIRTKMPSFTISENIRDSVITKFTLYRQRLVKLGMALTPSDVQKISAFYNKEHTDSWSLIMDLEHNMVICEENMIAFIERLKKLELHRAVKALTEDIPIAKPSTNSGHTTNDIPNASSNIECECDEVIDIKVILKRKRGSSDSDGQPHRKYALDLLKDLDENKDCLDFKDIPEFYETFEKLIIYYERYGLKLTKVGKGSIVFYLSANDPNALMQLWEIHSSGKLIKDIAEILVPEKHQQEFLDEWMTYIDESEYKTVLNKLNGKEETKSETPDLPSPTTLEETSGKLSSDEHKAQLMGSSENVCTSLERSTSALSVSMDSFDRHRFGHLNCQVLNGISIDTFKNDIATDSVKSKLQNLEKRGDRPLYCQSMKTMFATILFRASTNNPKRQFESQRLLEEVLEKDETNLTSLADLIYINEHIGDVSQAEILKKRLIENQYNDLALARTYYDRAHIIRHFEQDKRRFTYFEFLEMSREHIEKVNRCNNVRIETERAEILFDYSLALYRKYYQKTEFRLLEESEIQISNLMLEQAINGFLDVVDIKFSPGECTALSWIFIAILLRLKKSFDQDIGETASYANERLGDITVEQCLEKGLQFAPQNANVLRRIASEYVHLNKNKEALHFFQSSINIEKSWFAFHHQGLLYLKMYNESDTKDDDYLSKAQYSFEKAIELKETHKDVSDLGYIFFLRGEKKILLDQKHKEGRNDLHMAIFFFHAAVNMTDCDDDCNLIKTFERWAQCLKLTGDSKGLIQVRQMSIERESLLVQREIPFSSTRKPDSEKTTNTSAISLTDSQHDFYVVTSESDYEWVVRNLMPTLEGEFELKGFLSQRDQILGENDLATLVSAIHSSRYNIIILSPDFLSCNWCKFFMEIMVYSAVKRDSTMLLLMLQQCDIPKRLQPFREKNLIVCVNKSIDANCLKQLQGIFNKT